MRLCHGQLLLHGLMRPRDGELLPVPLSATHLQGRTQGGQEGRPVFVQAGQEVVVVQGLEKGAQGGGRSPGSGG